MRFSSLVKIYMDDSRNRIKYSTYVTRRSIISKHILPFFAKMAINCITPTDVNRWQNWILTHNAEKSPQYLHKLNLQLSTIFRFAEKFYKLNKNPAKACAMLGSTKRKNLSFWTLGEFKRFIKAIDGQEPLHTISNVLFWSGVRRGELLALRPSDFDFEKNSLSVSRNVVFTVPLTPSPHVLKMRAESCALSPTRTKRGTLGCTITFFDATAVASICPLFISLS